MLSSPLRISGPRVAKFNPIREHPLRDAVAGSDDNDDISLMDDSERSSDNDVDVSDDSDDSIDIKERIPLSQRVQKFGRAPQTLPHNFLNGSLSTTPPTTIKKRISPILVSAATSVTPQPLVSTSTPPADLSRQPSTPSLHRASGASVHTMSSNTPQSLTSPSPTHQSKTIVPTLIQYQTDHTPQFSKHSSPRKDRKGSYLPQMGLTLARIFYNQDGTRLDSESDSEDWTIRPTFTQRRSMQPGYKRLVQQNLKRIFRDPPIFDLPEHTVYAPLKRKDKNVPVTVVAKSKVSPKITTSTWDQIFQELASSTVRVELQADDMTSFDFKAATKGLTKKSEQPAVQKEDDFLYPVYGESDASAYTTDEELYKQVAKEEHESMKRKSKTMNSRPKRRPLPGADVDQLVSQYIVDRTDRWSRTELPKLVSKRQKIYDAANGKEFELDLLRREIDQLTDKRLQDATGAMMRTTYHSAAEVLRACKALDATVDLICLDRWKVGVLAGPDPRLDPPLIETKPAYSPKGVPKAKTRKPSIDPEEQKQRDLDRAFIVDDNTSMGISDDSGVESEYGTPEEDIDMEEPDVSSEPEIKEPVPQSRATPEEEQEPSEKDKENPSDTIPQDDVVKKRKKRDASPIESTAKKPRDYSGMDIIVIDDEDGNNDTIASPNEDATVPTSIINHKTSIKTESSEYSLLRVATEKIPRDDQAGDSDRQSSRSTPQFDADREMYKSHKRRSNRKKDDSMDVDPQPSGEPKPTPRKEMETPNWVELLDLDTLPEQLRAFRRNRCRLQRFPEMEPLLSAFQEYTEWIELDVEDNLSISRFIAWKRLGHTTNEYRKQAAVAAKALAEKEDKERRDKEQRDRERKDEERREKARREKEKESEQGNEASSQQASSSGRKNHGTQRSSHSIDDDTEDDEVLLTGKSEILEVDEVMMEGKTEIHETGSGTNGGTRKRRKDDAGSSSSGSDSEPIFKKRARPARRFGDTDESGSDSDSDTGPTRTRLPKAALSMKDEAEHVLRIRRDAAKNELELQKRIKEQELRGHIQLDMNPSAPGAVLINRGHKKTEKSVPIPEFLLEHLKPHQVDGIVFMWKNVVMFDNGCILAHSMGLGKTFQVISFIYILLREIQAGNKDIPKKLRVGFFLMLSCLGREMNSRNFINVLSLCLSLVDVIGGSSDVATSSHCPGQLGR